VVTNQLKMAIVQSIYLLHAQGLSGRQIARTLGIGRGTVARHLRRQRQSASNGAIAPIEPARVGEAPNGAIAPTGLSPAAASAESAPAPVEAAVAGAQSRAARWRDFILKKRAQGLSAKRIHQDLMDQPGTEHVSYDSVRRLVTRLGATHPLPFRRLECMPGAEAQVAFTTMRFPRHWAYATEGQTPFPTGC
jgi:transposase